MVTKERLQKQLVEAKETLNKLKAKENAGSETSQKFCKDSIAYLENLVKEIEKEIAELDYIDRARFMTINDFF